MAIKDGLYRGRIVGRSQRISKDGLSEFLDLDIGAEEAYEPLSATWQPIGDYPEIFSASYFIRSQGEVNAPALESFGAATGWNFTDEDFASDSWIPNKVQVRIKVRAKTKGDGQWITITDIAPFDAPACGKASAGLTSTLAEFRKITGRPSPAATAPSTQPQPQSSEVPF